MYTDPVIVHNDVELNSRSYVKTYIDGQRFRFYNGKDIGINCYPNRAKNLSEKIRLLNKLQYELKKKLEKGWQPTHFEEPNPYRNHTLTQCITEVLKQIQKEDISDYYRRDMGTVGEELQEYLRSKNLQRLTISLVNKVTVEKFLEQFNTSGTYYMTKRSSLGGLFKRMVSRGMLPENPVHSTGVKKSIPELNVIFTKDQLNGILDLLKLHHPNLYLCSLLMYGCFLRPHKEVRLLKREHLNDDMTKIALSGTENKSKRIRVIRLPKYVTKELVRRNVKNLPSDYFVLSESAVPFNPDYFKTVWGRFKTKLIEKFKLRPNHTLYSFRHTAAVEVYNKTKDPYRVQRAMFHASLTTTLVYLRSLGLLIDNDVNDAPELEAHENFSTE